MILQEIDLLKRLLSLHLLAALVVLLGLQVGKSSFDLGILLLVQDRNAAILTTLHVDHLKLQVSNFLSNIVSLVNRLISDRLLRKHVGHIGSFGVKVVEILTTTLLGHRWIQE